MPLNAAVYCRVSLARFGDTVKVDDQEVISRNLAAERGWNVQPHHVFVDNSRSAWQRNRKRPGWDALLEAINRGEIQAIVVYHGDRLIRQPWDLELLIRVAEERGLRLVGVMGERNLDSPDDRYILRIEAAGACRESDNTSRRLKRHHERRAHEGLHRPGGRGGRTFGFENDGITHRADEVKILRDLTDRILSGESTGALCRELNARGVRTTAGNPWLHGSLKRTLLRPRMAGLIQHGGQILGPAAWEPVLDRVKWETLCHLLTERAGKYYYTTNARRYLLTGIALCGFCEHPLAIGHSTREESLRGYRCINPACTTKVHRSVAHLDKYVEAIVLHWLSTMELGTLGGEPSVDLAEQLNALNSRREKVLREFGDDDDIGSDVLRISVARLDKRIADVRARIHQTATSHALSGLLGCTPGEWKALPMERRRAAVQATVQVKVFKSRRGPGFDKSTVEVTRRALG